MEEKECQDKKSSIEKDWKVRKRPGSPCKEMPELGGAFSRFS